MKTLFTLALIVTLLVPFPVAADVVTEWNELTTATAMSSGQGGLAASRTTGVPMQRKPSPKATGLAGSIDVERSTIAVGELDGG